MLPLKKWAAFIFCFPKKKKKKVMNVGGERWGVEQEVPFCFVTELPLPRK